MFVSQRYKITEEDMREKLEIFKDSEMQDKEDVLSSLDQFYEEALLESGYSSEQKREILLMIKSFINEIKKATLPNCDDWWFYDYELTQFGIDLNYSHCESVEYSTNGESEMTIDTSYVLITVPCKMISVSEFASMHQVTPVAVRQWIRRGKLRYIKKHGRDWLISAISKKPTRRYIPVSYKWTELESALTNIFPFLIKCNSVSISQNEANKNKFNVRYCTFDGRDKLVELKTAEREKLELSLLSSDNVEVDELECVFPSVVFKDTPCKETNISSKVEATAYGPVLITMGEHKGRIGIYDDESYERGQCLAIVHFGSMSLPSDYEMIPFDCLSGSITTYNLVARIDEITRELWKRKDDVIVQNEGLHEIHLCSKLLEDRYINARERMKMKENHNIFISHASQDLHVARALATDLINDGFSVFLDDWSIDLGENIISRISESIEESNFLVMLISDDYLRSTYCSDEWTSFYMKYRKTRKNSMYSILLDEAEPPAILSAIKYARVRNLENYREAYNQLLKAIKKHSN